MRHRSNMRQHSIWLDTNSDKKKFSGPPPSQIWDLAYYKLRPKYFRGTTPIQPKQNNLKRCQVQTLSVRYNANQYSCLLPTNLVRVYKKGFYKKRHKGEEESTNGYASQWLSWIRPALFPVGKTWYVTTESHNCYNVTHNIFFVRRAFFAEYWLAWKLKWGYFVLQF